MNTVITSNTQKRSPITMPNAAGHRLCSFPNGLWQLQSHHGGKGLHHVPAAKGRVEQPHVDPWQAVHRTTTLDIALSQLNARRVA